MSGKIVIHYEHEVPVEPESDKKPKTKSKKATKVVIQSEEAKVWREDNCVVVEVDVDTKYKIPFDYLQHANPFNRYSDSNGYEFWWNDKLVLKAVDESFSPFDVKDVLYKIAFIQ